MRVIDDGVVYRNPHPAYRSRVASASTLTWVVDHQAGHLLCAFRIGQAKMSADGTIHLRRSDDGGVTWRAAASPFDEVGPNRAGPHLGSSAAGTTILAVAQMDIADPADPDWAPDAGGIRDATTEMARRRDDRWGGPTPLDHRRHDGEWAIPCGPPLAIGTDAWFFPMERHSKVTDDAWLQRYHAFGAISRDDGRTWAETAEMPNDPTGRLAYYDQRVAILGNGDLLTVAWVHDVVADATQTARSAVSGDGGRTWSMPLDTGIVGGPVNPIRLHDGRLLAVYNRRTAPAGIRAVLSEDDGRSWRLDDEFVLYDEGSRRVIGEPARQHDRRDDPELWKTMWGWTFGTPTPVQLPDGTIVVTFFAAGFDGVSEIRVVRLQV